MLDKKIYPQGIHNITNEEYHSSAGVSRSGILEFKRSPKHFWYKYINPNYTPKPPTPEMEFGTAVHAYILEPKKFAAEYYVMHKNPYKSTTKAGIAFKKEQLALAGNKVIINHPDFERLLQMAESVANDPQTDGLITGAQYEQSIYWTDIETGLLCKARPDILHSHFVVDLKTAKDASPRAFQREFYDRAYHLQLAFIHMGIKATTGKHITDFIDLAIEKEPPYCTAIYPIDEAALQHGIDEVSHYLLRLKECIETNEWPSYQTQVINLPAWATIGEQ